MGTSGSEAVLHLIDRGIHVLAEHPLRPAYLKVAIAKAAERAVCFHVNAHLAELPGSRRFINEYRSVFNGKPPSFITIMATDRSLYATIDLLMHTLHDYPDFHLASRSTVPQFAILNGSFGPIGASFQIQTSISADGRIRPDGGAGYLVDCRVAVAGLEGMLTLMSINGPVVWNANYGGVQQASAAMWKLVGSRTPENALQLYSHRVQANLDSIEAIARCRNGNRPPRIKLQIIC
jgi:thiazolinyl imide reductase